MSVWSINVLVAISKIMFYYTEQKKKKGILNLVLNYALYFKI